MTTCKLKMTQGQYQRLWAHLFPGDDDEHGAVLKAGLVQIEGQVILTVREVHLAKEGVDYVPGKIGHRALVPGFIHRHITACRNERMVYLAVHNHFSNDSVGFSTVDMNSHERGYPALRDIARGMPVGALVFGMNSVQCDLWMPNGERLELKEAVVIGPSITRLYPQPPRFSLGDLPTQERQIRLFGQAGQHILKNSKVAVIGLGGVGSLVSEYLARLGVGNLVLVDPDKIEETNLSRVVGATAADVTAQEYKVDIAKREALKANPSPKVTVITADFVLESVVTQLRDCDYLFLAADSMRARLMFNALVHQYLIPGVQLGAKVTHKEDENFDAWSAIRSVRPGDGCLWCNQLIDPHLLAEEAKSDAERKAQAYGIKEPNPSVITLNAVAAAHGVNDFLFDFLAIRPQRDNIEYRHMHSVQEKGNRVLPRKTSDCTECSGEPESRFGRADGLSLPSLEG